MSDVFTPYEAGLTHLLERLGPEHRRHAEALTLQARLLENIARARRHGDDETRRADRAQIVEALNGLALDALGVSYNDLCQGEAASEAGKAGPSDGSTLPPAPPRPPTASLPDCPFIAGPMIRDPRLFVGRKAELRTLARRLEGAQPTSINIVGERRIGKSSLLYHFYQTWTARVQNTRSPVVIYLSLQEAQAQTEDGFYRALLSQLAQHLTAQRHEDLRHALEDSPSDRTGFTAAMRQCGYAELRPVFCLDEFEALLKRPKRFDDDFYDALRALMDVCPVMFVVASRRTLQVYRRQHKLTSPFFNQAHTLVLRWLTEDEANDLVRLPASTVPGTEPALGPEEQRLARRWGGRHPCLLQLAADALLQAREEGRDADWAHTRYREQARHVSSPRWRWLRRLPRRCASALGWIGRTTRRLGTALDEAQNWLIGALILIVVILVLLGPISGRDVLDLLRHWLGG
jgi:uncharacterized protein